jgi:hypothetical protein
MLAGSSLQVQPVSLLHGFCVFLFAMHLQEALKLLLAHGCNIKASAMDDMNALHFAAQKGQLEAVRRLIAAGGASASVLFCVFNKAAAVLAQLKGQLQAIRHLITAGLCCLCFVLHALEQQQMQRNCAAGSRTSWRQRST